MTAAARVIRGFQRIARRRGWHIPHMAFGNCTEGTEEFLAYARSRSVTAQEIQLQGYRADPTRCRALCDSRWLQLPPRVWQHYAVRIGRRFIDWTARQFDPQAAFPASISLRDWRKAWLLDPHTQIARRIQAGR